MSTISGLAAGDTKGRNLPVSHWLRMDPHTSKLHMCKCKQFPAGAGDAQNQESRGRHTAEPEAKDAKAICLHGTGHCGGAGAQGEAQSTGSDVWGTSHNPSC